MRYHRLAIAGVMLITPSRHSDNRGYFSETYSRAAFARIGVDLVFVQDNQSFSARAGTVRGLHYQRPPFAQAKLVQVLQGLILDVAVDVRRNSPSFGQHVTAELSSERGEQLFIPEGFLHGFVTLAADSLVAYKVTAPYAPECEGAVRWNDPDLAIDWTVEQSAVTASDKDAQAPAFAGFESPFDYALPSGAAT